MRMRALAALVLLLAACGAPAARQDGGRNDSRLDGEWQVVLTITPSPFWREAHGSPASARGTVAFVPNRAGAAVPDFGGAPQEVGTHDLRLGDLLPEFTDGSAIPVAAGSVAGDSVRLVLRTGSGEPVILRGRWSENVVTGDWMAHRRAGIDQEGRFTLRRLP